MGTFASSSKRLRIQLSSVFISLIYLGLVVALDPLILTVFALSFSSSSSSSLSVALSVFVSDTLPRLHSLHPLLDGLPQSSLSFLPAPPSWLPLPILSHDAVLVVASVFTCTFTPTPSSLLSFFASLWSFLAF